MIKKTDNGINNIRLLDSHYYFLVGDEIYSTNPNKENLVNEYRIGKKLDYELLKGKVKSLVLNAYRTTNYGTAPSNTFYSSNPA